MKISPDLMSARAYKMIAIVLLCVTLLLAWKCWVLFGQEVWFDFIEKQCMITQDIIGHPPDGYVPEGLANRLEFLMGYYDAHSKSLIGSPLEPVLKRDYQRTLTNAVVLFRSRTTNDLGSDPKMGYSGIFVANELKTAGFNAD